MGNIELIREFSHQIIPNSSPPILISNAALPHWLNALLEMTPHGMMVLNHRGFELTSNSLFVTAIERLLDYKTHRADRAEAILKLPGFQKAFDNACAGWSSTLSIGRPVGNQPSDQLAKSDLFCFSLLSQQAGVPTVCISTSRQLLGNEATFARFIQQFKLTQCERSVVRLLAQGQSPESIATNTAVMVSTIRSHIRSVLQKVGADSVRTLLITLAEYPTQTNQMRQSNS